MKTLVTIRNAELEEDYCIVVAFSDGTTAAYSVEELLELRPYREMTDIPPSPSDVQ